jgi:UDP-sulfoquinovose synthase
MQGFSDISVQPHYLTEDVMEGMFRVVENYKGNIPPLTGRMLSLKW